MGAFLSRIPSRPVDPELGLGGAGESGGQRSERQFRLLLERELSMLTHPLL
jgi:hypothetical protein